MAIAEHLVSDIQFNVVQGNNRDFDTMNPSRSIIGVPSMFYSFQITPLSNSTIEPLSSHSLAPWLRILSPLRPLPGGRRLAADRTGVSDCAGFAPN